MPEAGEPSPSESRPSRSAAGGEDGPASSETSRKAKRTGAGGDARGVERISAGGSGGREAGDRGRGRSSLCLGDPGLWG